MSEDLRKQMDAVDLSQQAELDLNRKVDAAQEAALEANKITDAAQQKSIDKLENSQFWMMLMLAINTLASLAQIWESITVWMRLK